MLEDHAEICALHRRAPDGTRIRAHIAIVGGRVERGLDVENTIHNHQMK